MLYGLLGPLEHAFSSQKTLRDCADLKHPKGQIRSENSAPGTEKLVSIFHDNRIILGDDPRIQHGRAEPVSDISLLALRIMNSSLQGSTKRITPEECLVLEDSLLGVEAGRRAGMRVIWAPHPGLATEYREREKEVLAGRVGLVEIGDNWQLGEIDDGWAKQLRSLEAFPFEKYGIETSKRRRSGQQLSSIISWVVSMCNQTKRVPV